MVVGPALALLVWLAPLPADRAALDGRALAAESLYLVLDQEIAATPGKNRWWGLRWRNRRWLGICLVLGSRPPRPGERSRPIIWPRPRPSTFSPCPRRPSGFCLSSSC